jgi:hypothetical protein
MQKIGSQAVSYQLWQVLTFDPFTQGQEILPRTIKTVTVTPNSPLNMVLFSIW